MNWSWKIVSSNCQRQKVSASRNSSIRLSAMSQQMRLAEKLQRAFISWIRSNCERLAQNLFELLPIAFRTLKLFNAEFICTRMLEVLGVSAESVVQMYRPAYIEELIGHNVFAAIHTNKSLRTDRVCERGAVCETTGGREQSVRRVRERSNEHAELPHRAQVVSPNGVQERRVGPLEHVKAVGSPLEALWLEGADLLKASYFWRWERCKQRQPWNASWGLQTSSCTSLPNETRDGNSEPTDSSLGAHTCAQWLNRFQFSVTFKKHLVILYLWVALADIITTCLLQVRQDFTVEQ